MKHRIHRSPSLAWQQLRNEGTGLEVTVNGKVTIVLDHDRRAVRSAQRAAYRFSARALRRLGQEEAAALLEELASFELDS